MADNYIVLRRSPDWTAFDIEQTRPFLAKFGLAEDLIIKFAQAWDKDLSTPFLFYREAMKEICLYNVRSVLGGTIVSCDTLSKMSFDDDDLLYFTDDDDWVHPHLFRLLRAASPPKDGFLWRSIFVGKLFADTPHERGGGALVQERPQSDVIYTNNYAVTGAAWNRIGAEKLLEHYAAQVELNEERFVPDRLDAFLSAANKHLCCTVCIDYNSRQPGFLESLPRALGQVVDEIEATQLSDRTCWVAESLAKFAAVNRSTLASPANAGAGPKPGLFFP